MALKRRVARKRVIALAALAAHVPLTRLSRAAHAPLTRFVTRPPPSLAAPVTRPLTHELLHAPRRALRMAAYPTIPACVSHAETEPEPTRKAVATMLWPLPHHPYCWLTAPSAMHILFFISFDPSTAGSRRSKSRHSSYDASRAPRRRAHGRLWGRYCLCAPKRSIVTL